MSQHAQRLAINGLRWTLGVVVLLEAVRFAFAPSALHRFASTGHLPWLRLLLGGGEILGALLFLVPSTSFGGGCLLAFIFAVVAALHLLNGQYDVGRLIVYALAAVVCIAHPARK